MLRRSTCIPKSLTLEAKLGSEIAIDDVTAYIQSLTKP
jgi:hypothetical protein